MAVLKRIDNSIIAEDKNKSLKVLVEENRDLSYANLFNANLSNADLSGANLSGADLSGANLYGADLFNANLSDDYIIFNSKYTIVIFPDYIQIGCEKHSLERWCNFTNDQILLMGGKNGLRWWKKWKNIIMFAHKELCERRLKK